MNGATDLICNDCGLAVSDGWYRLTLCPLLDRSVDPNQRCQVSVQGVLQVVRENEHLRDELDELEDEQEYSWNMDRFERIEKLRGEVTLWAGALRYLWRRSKAPSRSCPTCGWVPADSTILECRLHRLPLHLMSTRPNR